MTTGEKIDRAMTLAGLSTTELAEAVNCSPALIRALLKDEKKRNAVPLKYWILIGKALDVPLEYFLSDADDIDGEITQTIMTVRAIRAQKEEEDRYKSELLKS